jgi:flagellar basal-body rod protein FlgF
MADALTIAVQSMQNDMLRMDAISQNVANANTPGYRRTISTSKMFADVLQRTTLDGVGRGVEITMPAVASLLDDSSGPLVSTGKPLDVALTGDGYFELTTPNGLAYTRAGNFHVDEQGALVNQNGYAVSGKGGSIRVTGTAAPTIARNGDISEGSTVIGHLRVVTFENDHTLENTGDGLLRPVDSNAQPNEVNTAVRIGFLENSNVVPLREMISMMETSRHFESQQKLFQGYDEQISGAIQKLGQF